MSIAAFTVLAAAIRSDMLTLVAFATRRMLVSMVNVMGVRT